MAETYHDWLNQTDLDEALRNELEAMDDSAIAESFSVPLSFGTGGIRGILGAGPSKLNIYTVKRALFGYAQTLADAHRSAKVVIAHDNRHFSRRFAETAAAVLAHFKIHAYLFESLRPTPVLSFAVKYLDCDGGIMITASHNPKDYNGIKLYNALGGQLVPDEAAKVIAAIDALPGLFDLPTINYDAAIKEGLVTVIGPDVDDAYLEEVLTLNEPGVKTLNVGFTPEHGTATVLGPEMLERAGFNVYKEESQSVVDPDFTHTASANPENEEAFEKLMELGHKETLDLLIATDPDADRIGLAVYHEGKYQLLSGNQTGVLMLDYLIKRHQAAGTLPDKPVVFSTIVSTDMAEIIAKRAGFSYVKTLTGFKYIGEQMELLKETPFAFFFGFEESYGYIVKDMTRDKDALQAALIASLMAEQAKKEGLTLIDKLHALYDTYGVYVEDLENIGLKGLAGRAKIDAIMAFFRDYHPKSFIRKNLTVKEDFLTSQAISQGKTWTLNYPSDNVIKFSFKDFWFVLRPSGTEPKLKIYFMVKSDTLDTAHETLRELKNAVLAIVDKILESEPPL